jgi:hypothetical protein
MSDADFATGKYAMPEARAMQKRYERMRAKCYLRHIMPAMPCHIVIMPMLMLICRAIFFVILRAISLRRLLLFYASDAYAVCFDAYDAAMLRVRRSARAEATLCLLMIYFTLI